jgi:CRP-like cAMP-binding protein
MSENEEQIAHAEQEEDKGDVRTDLISALSCSSMLREVAQSCPESDRFRHMLKGAQIASFHAGQTIFLEGQRSESMYFLIGGTINIVRGGTSVAKLSQVGDTFGEVGVLTGAKRSAAAIAETKVTCVSVHPGKSGFTEKDSDVLMQAFQHSLTKLLTKRLQTTTNELAASREELERTEGRIRFLERNLAAREKEVKDLQGKLSKSLGWYHRSGKNSPS